MEIRPEHPGDEIPIRRLTMRAFAGAPHSSGTEADIVDRLRADGALAVSLVAADAESIVGHVAFSAVSVGTTDGWFGLGPVSVAPAMQSRGIGAALIGNGLTHLSAMGARGCVLLGDPAYYARFGFAAYPALTYPGPPPEYFQALAFDGAVPAGTVAYHPAFG